ncbi:hypothetical protein CR513_53989, partial [Mucuna pruriens]
MDSAQLNYTTIEKELLEIFFALEKFHSYLLGSKIIIFSNHAALCEAKTDSVDASPLRIQHRDQR